MHQLALILPLLMADPPIAAEATRPATPELPRRSGFSTEVGSGIALALLPTEAASTSLTGVGLRMGNSYRFLLGKHWRLGPMLAMGASLAEASLDDGTKVSGSFGQFTLAPELEFEVSRFTSLTAWVGPTLVASRDVYLGPELSLGLGSHVPWTENERRVGVCLRGTFAPLFALGVPNADPGYVALFTISVAAGVP